MKYVFGYVEKDGGVFENLKTVGDKHTDLTGFNSHEEKYSDCRITDNFRVIRKYKSDKDISGKCYDWYLIDCHSREKDFTEPLKEVMANMKAQIQAATTQNEFLEDCIAEMAGVVYG